MRYTNLLLTTIFAFVCPILMGHPNAESVVKKVIETLKPLQVIQYDQKRIVNEKSIKNYSVYQGHVYFDFRDTSSKLNCRYYFENNDCKIIYNGVENFELNKKNKVLNMLGNDLSIFNSLSFINHSIYTLRSFLPLLLKNDNFRKSVSDTTINSKLYYNLTFSLSQAAIDNFGRIQKLRGKANMEYSLLIDQESLMPFVLKRTNILSQDEVTLTYTNITTKELILPEKGWYYSSYFPEFKLNNNTKTSLISTGTQAPDFQIKDISNDNIYSLSSSKSKVLLLEFFIKNCGYCVEAVSKLNKLQQQYKEKGLDILGINPYDSKENIRNFIANNNPDYKVTVNGQNVAEKYGVSFYPSVILIDRSGKVIFSGSFDEAKIDNVLKNLIKL